MKKRAIRTSDCMWISIDARINNIGLAFLRCVSRCPQGSFADKLSFMADTTSASATKRRTNSALWYGLLATLFGIATQFFYFLRPPRPISHALPWINLLLPAIGLIFLFLGLARAVRRSAVHTGRIWGSSVTVIALLLLVGNLALFRHTRDVPNSAGAPQVGQRLPEFTLSDSSGQPTSLSQLFAAAGDGSQLKAVLLVFYRGYW